MVHSGMSRRARYRKDRTDEARPSAVRSSAKLSPVKVGVIPSFGDRALHPTGGIPTRKARFATESPLLKATRTIAFQDEESQVPEAAVIEFQI